MTYRVCGCGHQEEVHIMLGCLTCSCPEFEAELRVTRASIPFDWARDGDLA